MSRIPYLESAPLFLAPANQGLKYQLYACLLIYTYAMSCGSITSSISLADFGLLLYCIRDFEMSVSEYYFLKLLTCCNMSNPFPSTILAYHPRLAGLVDLASDSLLYSHFHIVLVS